MKTLIIDVATEQNISSAGTVIDNLDFRWYVLMYQLP